MITTATLASGRVGTFSKVPATFLANYFVLTFPDEPSSEEAGELFSRALGFGQQQSLALTGKPDAFVLIHSGHAARRSQGWHLHVVVIRNRGREGMAVFLAGWQECSSNGRALASSCRAMRVTRSDRPAVASRLTHVK